MARENLQPSVKQLPNNKFLIASSLRVLDSETNVRNVNDARFGVFMTAKSLKIRNDFVSIKIQFYVMP